MLSILETIGYKNSEVSQIGRSRKPRPILLSEEYFHPIISKLDKTVVLLLNNYIATDFRSRYYQVFLLCRAALSNRPRLSICFGAF